MGLVVLIQATSVIGHRRRYGEPERATLPTCDDERDLLRKDDTLSAEFDRRVEELDRHFDQVSINNNQTSVAHHPAQFIMKMTTIKMISVGS